MHAIRCARALGRQQRAQTLRVRDASVEQAAHRARLRLGRKLTVHLDGGRRRSSIRRDATAAERLRRETGLRQPVGADAEVAIVADVHGGVGRGARADLELEHVRGATRGPDAAVGLLAAVVARVRRIHKLVLRYCRLFEAYNAPPKMFIQ